ncbi:hypothetical protein SUGI_1135910 [Cryptomeria japonica]|nr:hypothetical protein SUGI_1135910 [Cryptomeria japonica]
MLEEILFEHISLAIDSLFHRSKPHSSSLKHSGHHVISDGLSCCLATTFYRNFGSGTTSTIDPTCTALHQRWG